MNWTLALGLGCFALGTLLGRESCRPAAPAAPVEAPPMPAPMLGHPLDYDISVSQSGDGRQPRTMHYARRGK